MQLTTIELAKSYLEFSAGHFTIFSATEREKMHGHNFTVQAFITAEIHDNGMAFDYAIYKQKLVKLCQQLNGYFLLPAQSRYFIVEKQGTQYVCHFNQKKLTFPLEDVIVLPIQNVTIEELAHWFVQQLTAEQAEIVRYHIHAITIKVFSSPGQSASATWEKTHG